MTDPFQCPAAMEADLVVVRAYWASMIRGANDMPFWDDFKPSALPELRNQMALLDVFNEPFRIRFGEIVGADIEERYGAPLSGQFLDEIAIASPLNLLLSQASAAVEVSKPNYYRASPSPGKADGYARLILPMWGNGRVEMLLCAFSWRPSP
jgi:hypothetical protein